MHAIDLDLGENSKVHYELVEGDNKTFKVDPKSGEIILLKPVGSHNLDHEIVVAAIDGGTFIYKFCDLYYSGYIISNSFHFQ